MGLSFFSFEYRAVIGREEGGLGDFGLGGFVALRADTALPGRC